MADEESELLEKAIRLARDAEQSAGSPVRTFGLDQKVLYWAETRRGYDGRRKSYYRPLQEPCLLSYWDQFRDLAFDQDGALAVVAIMTGQRQRLRTGPMFGEDESGKKFRFKASLSTDWIDQLRACGSEASGAFDLAARLFYRLTWEHPFTDGNGRFSRALIYGALARYGIVGLPCLGLNGAFEVHRNQIGAAFRQTHHTRSYAPLSQAIAQAVIAAAEMVPELP